MDIVFQEDEILSSIEPNEGMHRSRRNMLIGGLVGSLGMGVVGSLVFSLVGGPGWSLIGDLVWRLVFGLAWGLVVGLVWGLVQYGGAAILRHYILRHQLHHHCNTPWNFAAFLDEAVSRGFMTRVGGGYRFYHRLLQEHFANHEETTLPVAPILGPQEGDRTGGRRSE